VKQDREAIQYIHPSLEKDQEIVEITQRSNAAHF